MLTADAPHLDIVCRESSLEKAQALSDELAELCRTRSKTGVFRVLSYDELAKETEHYDLVLNTTSLGMYPKTGVSAVGEDVLSRCKAAFDAVYNPGKTKFLKLAASCGLKTVGGMGMLVCQAVAAARALVRLRRLRTAISNSSSAMRKRKRHGFSAHNKPKETGNREMDKKVKGEIIKSGNIVLSGFMGSGKTTVGRRLAAALDMQFVDMDLYIEKKTGMTVKEIFAEYGELHFRALETETVKELAQSNHFVIATAAAR